MPSKKKTGPSSEETCYVCGRTKFEVREMVQAEVTRIARSVDGHVTALQGELAEAKKQIAKIEAFVKKTRKDISWETAVKEPDAMLEFIPGLKDVWQALAATEPDRGRIDHTLSGQARLTVTRLRNQIERTQASLAKLKEAANVEAPLPFQSYDVSLAIPTIELVRGEVREVENPVMIKVLLCSICESILDQGKEAEEEPEAPKEEGGDSSG